MPYLDDDRKKFIAENPNKTFNEGDWNYLFTLAIIRVWEKTPRYKTIHALRKACYHDPQTLVEMYATECRLLSINISPLDIKIARELAFDEFYRRVGAKYESKKIKENGDVYPATTGMQFCSHPVISKIGTELHIGKKRKK